MSYLTANSFSSYQLTQEEELQGQVLTVTQKEVLQNLLVTNAEEKLRLEFDPDQPKLFIQHEAYKRGQIELLEYILETSTIAEEMLANPEYLTQLEE